MDRYTNHGGAQDAPVKDVAGLKRFEDEAVGMLGRFGAVHGLVEVRVKRLSDGVDPLNAKLRDVVEQLLVDELETLPIVFVFRFAMRGESVLETVEDRDESFDHASRGALRILGTLFFDALAVIRKIGLAAQHGLAQPFKVRRKFRHFRVAFCRFRVDGLGFGGWLEFGAIHFLVDVLVDVDAHFFRFFVSHRGSSPVSFMRQSTQNLNFTQRFAEKLGHVSHRGHGALVGHARGAKDAKRTLHEIVAHVRSADERKLVTRMRNLLDADQHVHGLGRFDAGVQKRHQAVFLLDRREKIAELRLVGTVDFADQGQLRDLLAGIEEKPRLVTLLNACIEAPEPVHVLIGVKEISHAGDKLALISAPYMRNDLVQGSLGVLGPTRMPYERAMTAVAYVAQLFSEALSKI